MGDRDTPLAVHARHQQFVQQLEKGFQRIQRSDEFRRYLDTVSRFHRYSLTNTMLIWLQRPDASLVAGFHTWRSLGRKVRKGETGIRIFAPMHLKTGAATEDDETEVAVLGFKPVAVFDVTQTEGDQLPEPPVTRLSGDEATLWNSLSEIAKSEGLHIDRGINIGSERPNGFYNRSRRMIWVDPDLRPLMASKTLCHELAHHFTGQVESREEAETIAESTAYIVLGHFGYDAGEYSFGYLAGWSDPATFKASIGQAKAVASRIIEFITERRVALERDLGAGLPVSGQPVSEASMGTRPGPHLHPGL